MKPEVNMTGVSRVRLDDLPPKPVMADPNPGRCTAIFPGSWPENARCERWADHESQHAVNIWLGDPILWKDCVPCGHCGEPIYEGMIPGTFTHFKSELKACELRAEPEPRNVADEIRRHHTIMDFAANLNDSPRQGGVKPRAEPEPVQPKARSYMTRAGVKPTDIPDPR